MPVDENAVSWLAPKRAGVARRPRDGWTDDCSRWQHIGRLASGEGWRSCLFLPSLTYLARGVGTRRYACCAVHFIDKQRFPIHIPPFFYLPLCIHTKTISLSFQPQSQHQTTLASGQSET